MFAGAKEVATIDAYAKNLGIKKFDLMIDWGWFDFITKPLFWVIDLIYHRVGNYGFAIIVLAAILKVIFAPFANQSYRAMVDMQRLEPEIEAIRDASTEPELANSEIIELYKRERVTAPSGCLPIIIQLAVFFAIYKVMFVTIEMRQLPFIGWIQDISVRDPTNIITLCGLLNWEPESLPLFGHFLHVGMMPAILGLTLWIIQLRIGTSLLGSFQKSAFAILPIATMFFVRNMKSADVIFLVTYNILSIAHFIILAGVNKQSVGTIKQYTAKFLRYGEIQPIIFLMMLAPILQNIFVLLVFWRRTPTPKTKEGGRHELLRKPLRHSVGNGWSLDWVSLFGVASELSAMSIRPESRTKFEKQGVGLTLRNLQMGNMDGPETQEAVSWIEEQEHAAHQRDRLVLIFTIIAAAAALVAAWPIVKEWVGYLVTRTG